MLIYLDSLWYLLSRLIKQWYDSTLGPLVKTLEHSNNITSEGEFRKIMENLTYNGNALSCLNMSQATLRDIYLNACLRGTQNIQ